LPLPLNFVDIQFLRLQGVCPFAGAPSFFAPLTGARAFLYPKRCSRKTWGRCLWRKDTSPKPPPETWGRSNFAPTPPNGQKGRACGPLPFGNPTPGLLPTPRGGGIPLHESTSEQAKYRQISPFATELLQKWGIVTSVLQLAQTSCNPIFTLLNCNRGKLPEAENRLRYG